MFRILMEDVKVCEAFKPQTMGGAATGDWINLAGYSGVLFVIHITQGHGSSGNITLNKAKTAAGGSSSSGITMPHLAKCEDAPGTSDTFTAVAAATALTPSTAGAGSSIYLIDVRAAELGDGYNFAQIAMALSNAGNVASGLALLYGPRAAASVDKLVTAIA